MLKAESTKYKMAMNMVLWKLKVCFNNTPGAVFKDFVCANLVLKKKTAEDERVALAISTATAAAAAAIVLPAPRGGLSGYFAPV